MNHFEAVNIPVGVCWTFFMCLLWKLHKIYMEGHICLINRTPVYLWLHKVVWTSHAPPVMEIKQSQEIFWMLKHWWYGVIIPPWTAFPPLSLCKILPLFMYLLYFLWNQVFTQWPLFLVLLIFCNYLSCIYV